MSALAITSALIALSGQCAPTVAPGTTLSFARASSVLDPLAIHSNADGRSYHPATKAEAIAIASSMIARGERPDLGSCRSTRGTSLSSGCRSPTLSSSARRSPRGLAYCMAVTTRAWTRGREAEACLRTAASTYNTGSPTRGFTNGYVHLIAAAAEHVIPAIAVQQATAPTDAATVVSPPPSASACVPPSPDDWHLSADQATCAPSEDGWHADNSKPSASRVDEADPPASATPPRSETANDPTALRP